MAGRSDEVKAGMNTEVDPVGSAWLLFLQHVRLMLIVQEFDDGHPGVAVVDVVAEAGSVDDCQADYPTPCFRIGTPIILKQMKIIPLKNFSSSSALVISISTVLSTCFAWRRRWSA